jgi:predicted acylesterase/phospholipase RssA/CRP-like cAMP-binding protein
MNRVAENTELPGKQLGNGLAEPARLSDAEISLLQLRAEERRYAAGDPLIRVGDPGDHIYLILEGRASVDRAAPGDGPRIAEERGPGELFGMLAFFSGKPSDANVRCDVDSRLAVMSRAGFHALFDEESRLWRRLQEIGLARMRTVQLTRHLDRLFGPFGAMLPFVIRDLENETRWLTLKSGEVLFRQGDDSDGVYLLMSGRLQMAMALPDGREAPGGTVVAGETVGEVALLTGLAQGHTVYAARDSELVRLSGYGFELMLQRNTRSIQNVSRILGDRLARGPAVRDSSHAPIRCISLIPADSEVELEVFAGALSAELRRFGTTQLLDSLMIERELGSPGIAVADENEAAGLRLNQWLHDQEENSRYLVYRGDPEWSAWSARCVRQTDQVVVVANAGSPGGLAAVAPLLPQGRRQWSLVLLHPPGLERPRDTARWLGDVSVESVFHVRRGNEADLARLGRILTGNAIGLVLGGGGARGFAHIGVIRALEELGIPVDMVGGTSMGAPIAGFLAQGLRGEEVDRRCRQAYRKIIDLTFPVVSLISGRRISESIMQQTGDWDIEDYWLTFFCVSTSLSTARPVIHRRGSSALAIRSSVSIPGVLPPVPFGGELLVDGGVLNNLPVDVMREINPFGTVIAVDVAAPAGPVTLFDYGTELSGWRVLAGKLVKWGESGSAPGIAATMMQSMVVGSALKRQQILEQGLADLYLNVQVKGVGLLQFEAQALAAQLGYEGALEPLRAWAAGRGEAIPTP